MGGAKNVPFSELEEKLPLAVKNKALPLILVCATGARAARAVAVAKKLGYEQAQPSAAGSKPGKKPVCRLRRRENALSCLYRRRSHATCKP